LGLISREDYNRILMQREKERLDREFSLAPAPMRQQALDLYRSEIAPTPGEAIRGEIVRLQEEMQKLTNAGAVVVSAATEIGNAFGNSFRGIIDGSMSAQQALGGFFKNVANAFLEMAAQIISKWLVMAALNAVLKLFPGGQAASANPTAAGGDVWGAVGRLFGENAMGNAYAKNGIVPFAYGGVVDRPTLFPFAKGIGLMGEAGPEAILPLRRGRDGKLGVTSSGNGNVVVNVSVDASGSSVQGDDQQANQLGRVVAIAVQQEMIKQKRPGGLLA
jgi:phage-related minor tail protein